MSNYEDLRQKYTAKAFSNFQSNFTNSLVSVNFFFPELSPGPPIRPKMESFATIFNGFYPSIVFAQYSIIDVYKNPGYCFALSTQLCEMFVPAEAVPQS